MKFDKNHWLWKSVDIQEKSHCWNWTGKIDASGYGYVGKFRAHRLAFEVASKRSIKDGMVVRHKCDNPKCCNPLHLTVGSQKENVADRVKRNRGATGEKNGKSILTRAQVREIYQSEGSYSEIALEFHVSKSAVADIKTGRNWSWLTGHFPNGKSRLYINTVPK